MMQFLKQLHRDEQGAEGLEKLLIIAAVVLPLLGLLIVFRDRIQSWIQDVWGDVAEDAGDYSPPPLDTPGS